VSLQTPACVSPIPLFSEDSPTAKQLADFVEFVGVALRWMDETGTILWANQAELDLMGFTREEYLGRNIADFCVDQNVIADILRRLKNDERIHDIQARVRRRDGCIGYVAIDSSAYRENGRFVHSRCVTRDMSKERQMAEVQERLAAIIDSSDDAILSKDLNGIIQSWNRGAERIFGYTAEEMIGKSISVLAIPERADEIPDILARILKGERVDHYETRRRAKDGRIIAVSLTVSPIRDASGTIIGASKVARDIGEQKRLSEVHELLAAIVESSDDAIISKDLNGIIRSWNRGAERLFGYKPGEILGRHISTLCPPAVVDEIPNILERIQRGERVDHYETKRLTKDGRILTVSLTVSPIRDSSGVVIGASKVARDMTERDRQETALREVNAALSRSNEDLQQFAYSASHDLREPLRMVAAYSELLKMELEGKLGQPGEQYIGYMMEGALRMEQLLDDLKAYTRVSTDDSHPTEVVNADEVLDKALVNLQTAISESGASISRSALPEVRIFGVQLEQLFQNLIGNAIRYRGREAPRVEISASRDGNAWKFSVRDNGIGIDPRYKEQIFGIFKRLHSKAEYPGTGMGLAICQRIVERLGGQIRVDSQLGHGSTFYFTIPV
jgi:PAS domain S-box-containing protein